MKPLILIVTRRCNLRCGYCDVEKRCASMNERVARKATLLYFEWAKKNKQKDLFIRFFGGEPLMNFKVVKNVIAYAKICAQRKKVNVVFDLTTNGILINDSMLNFFEKTPEMLIIISLDGDVRTQNLNRTMNDSKVDSYKNILLHKDRLIGLPGLTVNMVIVPNQVQNFYKNFLHNYNLGFQRFNFLPAYFTMWREQDLRKLIAEYNKLSRFLRAHKDVLVKNKETFSNTPFFNTGFVVDCNGDLFSNNLILSHQYAHLRDDLLEGNVMRKKIFDSLNVEDGAYMVRLMRNEGDPKLFYASMKVDAVLRNFVKKLNI